MPNILKLNLFLRCTVRCDFHGTLISNKKFKKAGYRKVSARTRQRDSTASKYSRSLDLIQPSGWKVEAWWLTHVDSSGFVMASGSSLRSLQHEASSKASRTMNCFSATNICPPPRTVVAPWGFWGWPVRALHRRQLPWSVSLQMSIDVPYLSGIAIS